jgi:hypothetical protein
MTRDHVKRSLDRAKDVTPLSFASGPSSHGFGISGTSVDHVMRGTRGSARDVRPGDVDDTGNGYVSAMARRPAGEDCGAGRGRARRG